MSESKIETTKGMCVVFLTRHLMQRMNAEYEVAYKKLLSMELYRLLQDTDTRLFLETNDYLAKACDTEEDKGIEAFYSYINDDSVPD